jgi:hypothetical protein
MTFVPKCRSQSTVAWRPQPAAHALFPLALIGVFAWPLAPVARAQQPATVRRDGAAFLAEPGGTRLGRVAAGTELATGQRQGADVQVTLDGWIFAASVQPDTRHGHELSVSPPEENLRAAPNGRVLARLVHGALLDEVERQGGWVHVRREGWVASAALGGPVPVAAAAGPDSAGAGAGAVDPTRGVLRRRVKLYAAPDSPATGELAAGVPVHVVARAGGWARIEAAGWVPDSAVGPASGEAISDVTVAQLRAAPEQWKGAVVRWTVQFIALQTADELRPDFQPGERYILARGPAPEYAFVYIAVPPDKVARAAQLQPLDNVTVLARVRSGRSRYLANPILELLDIVP